MTSTLKIALLAGGMMFTASGAIAQTAPAATPAPAAGAQPQANAAVATGATIYDTQGGVVGTVESVANGSAIVSTGTTKVNLPLASFGTGANGPTLALTRAQLEAEASQAAAASSQQLDQLLVAGSPVYGRSAGTQLGTIKAAEAQLVTVTATSGADVRLPRNGFGVAQGRLVIGMTADQFRAAVGSATAGAPTAGSAPAATTAGTSADAADTASPASTTATAAETAPATTATTPGATTPTTGTTPPRN